MVSEGGIVKGVARLLPGLLALQLIVAGAMARHSTQVQQIAVGTWTLVSAYEENEAGEDIYLFGNDPRGEVTLDSEGHFSFQIIGPGIRFASNDRLRGTRWEYQAAAQDSLSYFGQYTLDATNGELILHVERCTFPNWNGTYRKTSAMISGDTMIFESAVAPSPTGAYYSKLTWTRIGR